MQFENKGGAGGTIGLAQFVNSSKGDPNARDDRRHGHGRRYLFGKFASEPLAGDAAWHGSRASTKSSLYRQIRRTKTMADLVKALKANPGGVSWGGGSAGGTDHILAGLIAKASGGGRSQQD